MEEIVIETKIRLSTIIKWILSGFIDSLFLIFWVLIQWGTQRILGNLELMGIDRLVFYIFQALFAISTLAPVVIFMYSDIATMVIRAKLQIQTEKQRKGKKI